MTCSVSFALLPPDNHGLLNATTSHTSAPIYTINEEKGCKSPKTAFNSQFQLLQLLNFSMTQSLPSHIMRYLLPIPSPTNQPDFTRNHTTTFHAARDVTPLHPSSGHAHARISRAQRKYHPHMYGSVRFSRTQQRRGGWRQTWTCVCRRA